MGQVSWYSNKMAKKITLEAKAKWSEAKIENTGNFAERKYIMCIIWSMNNEC